MRDHTEAYWIKKRFCICERREFQYLSPKKVKNNFKKLKFII